MTELTAIPTTAIITPAQTSGRMAFLCQGPRRLSRGVRGLSLCEVFKVNYAWAGRQYGSEAT
ncbi:MAG TPA: hypothetical protein VI756_31210, partial [Blastocatellia bacterium]